MDEEQKRRISQERPSRDEFDLMDKFVTPTGRSSQKRLVVKDDQGREFVIERELPYSELHLRDFSTSNLSGKMDNELYLVQGYLDLSDIMQYCTEQGNIDLTESHKYFLDQAHIISNTAKSKSGWLLGQIRTNREESHQEMRSYQEEAEKKKGFKFF